MAAKRALGLLRIASAAPPYHLAVLAVKDNEPFRVFDRMPDIRTAELFRSVLANPSTPYRSQMLGNMLLSSEPFERMGPVMRKTVTEALRKTALPGAEPFGELPAPPAGNTVVPWTTLPPTPLTAAAAPGATAPPVDGRYRIIQIACCGLTFGLPAISGLWLAAFYGLRPRGERTRETDVAAVR